MLGPGRDPQWHRCLGPLGDVDKQTRNVPAIHVCSIGPSPFGSAVWLLCAVPIANVTGASAPTSGCGPRRMDGKHGHERNGASRARERGVSRTRRCRQPRTCGRRNSHLRTPLIGHAGILRSDTEGHFARGGAIGQTYG